MSIFLLKYNSLAGTLLWTQITGSAACAYGVAVSVDGFIYVTGNTEDSLNGQTFSGCCHVDTVSLNLLTHPIYRFLCNISTKIRQHWSCGLDKIGKYWWL